MFDHPLALELAYTAVEESIRLGASYADARYELRHEEDVRTRNGRLAHAGSSIERGLGIRVLVRGSWGYVGISEPNRHDVAVAAKRAVEAARAAAILQDQPVELSRQDPQRALFRTKIRRDPLAVPLEDKISLLLGVDDAARSVEGVVLAESSIRAQRVRKIFVSSDGSELDQELVSTGAGFRVGAESDGDLQFRSFPGGAHGLVLGRGWELVTDLGLTAAAPEVAAEAVALSRAPVCADASTTLVLTGSQVAHHLLATTVPAFELDRMLGQSHGETAGSFLGLDGLGGMALGPESLNVYADARELGGAGTFGYDDEGVEAQKVDLVSGGRFTGVLSDRESAHRVGLESSSGNGRAPDWSTPASVWPTNVSMAPSAGGTLDELIEDTSSGVLVDGPVAFALDPFGQTYTATAEAGWRIDNGQRGEMVKNPVYRGRVQDFWQGLDGVCGASDWSMYGAFMPARGRGRRALPVGVGAASARFRDVAVSHHGQRPAPAVASIAAPLPTPEAAPRETPPARKTKARRGKRKAKRVRKKDTK